MTSPPRFAAEALLVPRDAGARRISLRPIFGRIQHLHQHENELLLLSSDSSPKPACEVE